MRRRPDREAGQTLVEFSLAITVFMLLLMGIIDLGRLVYQYSGVSEAARALARETSVHPGSTLGGSAETTAVLGTHQLLLPIGSTTYTCVDIAGTAVAGACDAGNWVRVTVASPFTPATPLATILGPVVLTSAASAKIE
jgi:Flp pilus assembly protein TadG